jgi:hypothetical protein
MPNGELPIGTYRPETLTDHNYIGGAEGHLKPQIIAYKTGSICTGAAGGNFAGSPELFKETLKQLRNELGTNKFLDWLDAGAIINPHVTRTLSRKWELLKSCGHEVYIAWYGQTDKSHSDPDELNDYSQVEFIPLAEFLEQQSIDLAELALPEPRLSDSKTGLQGLISSFKDLVARARGDRQHEKEFALAPVIPDSEIDKQETRQSKQKIIKYKPGNIPQYRPDLNLHFKFEPGQRSQLWVEAIAKGWWNILDKSNPNYSRGRRSRRGKEPETM